MPIANTQTQPHSEADAQPKAVAHAEALEDTIAFSKQLTYTFNFKPTPDLIALVAFGINPDDFRVQSDSFDLGLGHAEAHGFTGRDAYSFAFGYAHAASHWSK